MSEELKNIFINNSTQLWTLLAVIVGGLCSFFSTFLIESYKLKYELRQKHLNQILVPYCTTIENNLRLLNRISNNYNSRYSNDINYKECIDDLENLKNLFEYLSAEKRIYLSKSMIYKLNNYKTLVDLFYIQFESDYKDVFSNYEMSLLRSLDLEKFKILRCNKISIFSKNEYKIKFFILNNFNFDLFDNVTAIHFINDIYDSHILFDIDIENEKDYWKAINSGISDIQDLYDEDHENLELACNILDHLSTLSKNCSLYFENTRSAKQLTLIKNQLNLILKELIKKIDKLSKSI